LKGFIAFASRNSGRKQRKDGEVPQITSLTEKTKGADDEVSPANTEIPSGITGVQVEAASRSAVLQACILTSAGLLLFGVLIRQVIYQSIVMCHCFSITGLVPGFRQKIFQRESDTLL
jgi:hypothetical protein